MTRRSVTTPSAERSLHCSLRSEQNQRAVDKLITLLKKVLYANWTAQDSKDQKCFSCVVVSFGEHVIDVVRSKQDVVSLSAPESEFYAMSSGGAQGIHTKNICSDVQIYVSHVSTP